MYETTDALFTGICDAIREKDGTTGPIRHQQIPERIAAISECGEGTFISPFYTYGGTSGLKLENMVASNFTAYNAVFLECAFLPADSPWEIKVKFTWPEHAKKATSYIFGSWGGNIFQCPTLYIIVSNGVSRIVGTVPDGADLWNNIGSYVVDNPKIGNNYWVRFIFDGNKYNVLLSIDGKNFDDIIQIDYGVMYQHDTNSKVQFGGAMRNINYYFEGSIDLKETYIKIGEEVWWGKRIEK